MLNIKTAVGVMTGLTLKEQLLTYMKKYCSISVSIEQDLKNNKTPRSVYVNLAKSISEIEKYDLEDAFNIVWFAKFKDSDLVKKAKEEGISTEDYYEVCKEMTLLESDSSIKNEELQRRKEEITHKGFKKAFFALPAEEEVYFDVLILEELEYTMRVYEKLLGRDLTDLDVKNLNETLKNMVNKYKADHENLKPKEARALSAFGREPSVDASSLREAWASRSRTSTSLVDNRPERSQALNPLGSPPAAEPLTFIKKQKTANASVKEKEPEPVPVKELPSWDSVNAQGLHKELKNILGGTQRRQQQAALGSSRETSAPEAPSAHGESSGVYTGTGEEQEQAKASVYQQIPTVPENTISSEANAGAAGAAGAGGGNWLIAFLILLGLGSSSAVYYLWPPKRGGRRIKKSPTRVIRLK